MTNKKESIHQVYANAKQLKFMKSRAGRKTFLGGRGSGKTTTSGYTVGQMFEFLPRAKIVLTGLTYVQLDLIVLPEIKNALSRMRYVEYTKSTPWGVYVIGQQPPDNWPKPYSSPGKRGWQYCISFINGFCIQLVSQDRPDSQRGINSDGVIADESATLSEDFLNKIILPAKRANKLAPFAKSHLHLCFYDFTSAPWTVEGGWMLKTEDAWKAELEVRARMTEDEKLKSPPKNLFLESTWEDNRDVLPDNYYADLEATLDALTLDVEVWNRRFTQRPDGFYHSFSTNKHCYVQSYRYEFDDKTKLHLHQTNDYREDRKLEVSLDFNAAICWLVICQEIGREFRTINSIFKKPALNVQTNLIIQLAQAFDATYAKHPIKEVDVWGDPNGKSKNAATSDSNRPFLEQFCDHLIKQGWRVNRRYTGFLYPSHKNKYLLINHLLEEGSERLPKLRFNQNLNKPLLIAVQQTRITGDFNKDKGSETTAKNREYATDGTDAYDYIVWGKYKKLMPSGVKRGFSNSIVIISR
ncbi:hypothetical protein [Spirosoma endbachense]|uniref:Phage terminase large subunit N-terminal domain-containing protein n=1 Tax=Spirosoma endbachense TaxID=2666025 RepID=A0A6P1VXV4_9BACT|nr:hypothetical protein [Spirosoma endbachense]QHV97953.1 hypothetical protein GJR95_24385 [Spirosoma endbachense]